MAHVNREFMAYALLMVWAAINAVVIWCVVSGNYSHGNDAGLVGWSVFPSSVRLLIGATISLVYLFSFISVAAFISPVFMIYAHGSSPPSWCIILLGILIATGLSQMPFIGKRNVVKRSIAAAWLNSMFWVVGSILAYVPDS
jgi:hypothetical protein